MINDNNKPIIVPYETKASLIKYAFEAYVNGTPQSKIRRELAKIKQTKNGFERYFSSRLSYM